MGRAGCEADPGQAMAPPIASFFGDTCRRGRGPIRAPRRIFSFENLKSGVDHEFMFFGP
jgi:hypothetical protein